MHQFFIYLAILLFPSLLFAQEGYLYKTDLPYDEFGNIKFERIFNFDSLSKDQLYSRAKTWFVENYKSANDVLQMDDKESGRLIAKGIHVYVVTDLVDFQFDLWHQLKVYVKDNKAKIVLEGLKVEYSGVTMTMKELVSDEVLYKKNGKPKKGPKQHKENLLKFWIKTSANIKKALKEDDDDW